MLNQNIVLKPIVIVFFLNKKKTVYEIWKRKCSRKLSRRLHFFLSPTIQKLLMRIQSFFSLRTFILSCIYYIYIHICPLFRIFNSNNRETLTKRHSYIYTKYNIYYSYSDNETRCMLRRKIEENPGKSVTQLCIKWAKEKCFNSNKM